MATKTKAFDAAAYLDNEEVIAAYLQDALEDDDPNVFLLAVADVVRARSMTRLARDSGLGRESLYKTIKPGARPGFATVAKLLAALGVRLKVVPARRRRPAKKAVAGDGTKPGRRANPGKPAGARTAGRRVAGS